MILSQFNHLYKNSWRIILTPKFPEDKSTTQLTVLNGLLGHLCSEEYLKIPIIMDFKQMIINPLRTGLLKLLKMFLKSSNNQNVSKHIKLMMVRLMLCQLNSDLSHQIIILNIQLLINSILN